MKVRVFFDTVYYVHYFCYKPADLCSLYYRIICLVSFVYNYKTYAIHFWPIGFVNSSSIFKLGHLVFFMQFNISQVEAKIINLNLYYIIRE